MTTNLHETWTGGTAGTACTAANTAFNQLMTRFTFDDTHVAPGLTMSGKLAVTGQTAQAQASVTAADPGYREMWWYASSLPTAATAIASFRIPGANLAELRLNTDGSLMIRNAGFTSVATTAAGAFHTSQWMKIQWLYSNDAAQQRLRVFWTTPTGNSPDYDSGLVSTTAAGQATILQVGAINATTWTAWLGLVDNNTDGFIVPGGGGSGGTVTYRDGASAQATDSGHTIAVTIPSTVATGDIMTLKFAAGQQTNQTDPSGWTKIPMSQAGNNVAFDAWQRTATGTDHGTTVTVTSDNAHSFSRELHLQAYVGGKIGDYGSRLASTATTAHPAPQVTAVDAAAWIENGCVDRAAPPSSAFTLPSTLTQRTEQIMTAGGAAVSSVVGTDDAVGSGAVGSNTITGTVATTSAVSWTIAIEPTTATSPLTVSAGPDVFIEPWRTFTIAPSASTTPDSWSWSQLSAAAPPGFTAPASPTDMTSGATVDANGTIHLTAPAEIVPMQYTLRVTGHKTGVADATDTVVVSVFPATRWFCRSDGRLVPIRYRKVT